jgi:Holliday junction resolvasome RuvABC endonuclease subunit
MILAIDPATKTGWAMLQDGKIIESGVEDFSKKRGESNGSMFFRFRRWLSDILENGLSIKLVVYEQSHHRGGASTEIGVNLTGRIQECCTIYGIEYATVRTTTLKKFFAGRGNAEKVEMIAKAKEILGRAPIDDNEADAVALALWGQSEYGRV